MKRYCTVCSGIHEGRCERPFAAFRARNSEADRFRNTQAWRRKSAAVMQRDRMCCRMCLKAGIIEYRRLSVHHIIPLAVDFDKRLDDDNLITLCRFHHERAERGQIKPSELRELARQEAALAGIPPCPTAAKNNDI